MQLDKCYDPKKVERKWYGLWEKNGLFTPSDDVARDTYTIVMPPPNVTGVLHMGHALNNTIQDILIRYKKMRGYKTLWIPGTDHAGIATQNVVEKSLAKKNKKRSDFTREEFVGLVWDWKEKHGNTIIGQLKELGCACDWSRERFTMDDGLSDAVFESFTRLYDKGLIYRGEYMINWCPRCRTALSDEEAEKKEQEGFLYYIKYPLGGSDDALTVATTRPETMLGDVAVAVHPEDERYKKYIGKTVLLPLTGRKIPIIADEFVDPEFGTGAVKITPAHDPNDFAMGQKHDLEFIVVMDEGGIMNENVPEKYVGTDRFSCRKEVLKDLAACDLFIEKKLHMHAVGRCYRCDTIVEPYLSKQWFVRMKPMAEDAIRVVEEGKIKFYPERWTKVYLNWMYNIRDWCISRQIWWGHRIPVFYCKNCQKTGKSQIPNSKTQTNSRSQIPNSKQEPIGIISKTKPPACTQCGSSELYQDDDVLDTWFSSWLWPISTLGWPEETKDLKTYYPTDTLVTAPEIIFFWVARMIMSGLEFAGEIPFKDVYIHGTVRDENGRKMSKSLGNTIDPLEIIDKYSADALRYTIMAITSQGQDVFLSEEKFEIGRNFCNKMWNATRFLMMTFGDDKNGLEATCDLESISQAEPADVHRWILSRLSIVIENVTKSIEAYRFNDAIHSLYDFFWGQFCDWYLELIKVDRDDPSNKTVPFYVLRQVLKLLYPFIPFITEEIWSIIASRDNAGAFLKENSIMCQSWPEGDDSYRDMELETAFERIQDIIRAIRNARKEKDIPPAKKIRVFIGPNEISGAEFIEKHRSFITVLTRAESLTCAVGLEKPKDSVPVVLEDMVIYISLEGMIDVDAERTRLGKQLQELDANIKKTDAKLDNKEFIAKAPDNVVVREREKMKGLLEKRKKIEEDLKVLT